MSGPETNYGMEKEDQEDRRHHYGDREGPTIFLPNLAKSTHDHLTGNLQTGQRETLLFGRDHNVDYDDDIYDCS